MQQINQDGRILWNGVLSLPKQQLATLVSLFEQTTIFTKLEKKGRDLVGAEDRFKESLENRVKELQKEEHELLVLKLLSCLGELADIPEAEFPTRRNVENLCEQFVEKALLYKSESHKDFEGKTLMDLVREGLLENLNKLQKDYKTLKV